MTICNTCTWQKLWKVAVLSSVALGINGAPSVRVSAFQTSSCPRSGVKNAVKYSSSSRIQTFQRFPLSADSSSNSQDDSPYNLSTRFRKIYSTAGFCSAAAWIALSISALSHHPDPLFIDNSWKHNLLTMSQAFAFPLPVMLASFRCVTRKRDDNDASVDNSATLQRLNFGVAVSFLYATASATIWAPLFAFGYDLYSLELKVIAGSIFFSTSLLAMTAWTKLARPKGPFDAINRIVRGFLSSLWSIAPSRGSSSTAALYATATAGFLWFNLLPLASEYPLVTIPTLLGKSLSRAAGAFTFLGAVVSYCLKDASEKNQLSDSNATYILLRRGLGWGSALHLIVIALKFIGIDDGGFLLPGRGLWELYPEMLALPLVTTMSLLLHAVVCFAAFSSDPMASTSRIE